MGSADVLCTAHIVVPWREATRAGTARGKMVRDELT